MNLAEESFDHSLLGFLDSMRDLEAGTAVFHCTLDDIGNCQADGIRGCVGYTATKKQWDNFNPHWDHVLGSYGLEYLHTSKFLAKAELIGPPKTDEDDFRILEPFIVAVREELLRPPEAGFGVIVITDCAGYDALSEDEKKWVRPHCGTVLKS